MEFRLDEWIDVTMAITPDVMVYKNKEEKKPQFIVRATHDVNGHHETSLLLDLHTATHIDMPKHMIKDGHTSETFDLRAVNGACVVVDFSGEAEHEVGEVFLKGFENKIMKDDIVIIKTKNAYDTEFNYDYDYLDASGAAFLASCGVKAVGIDALGIERSAPGHPTHNILLGNGIYIIEGLALKEVKEGRYELLCLPMKIAGVEGLPSRAFLKPL